MLTYMNVSYIPYLKETWRSYKFKHPVFQLIGLRNVIAGHTEREEKLLQQYAVNRNSIVEIGVAEGASALAIRYSAHPTGKLYLIDPYLPRKILGLNFTKYVAHRHVNSCNNARVNWIEDFSYNAVKNWHLPIDFLFIDGDHSYEGCLRDWEDWNSFVVEGGVVVFHDARLFSNGWTHESTGSVMVVDELFRRNKNPNWKIVDEVDSLVIVQQIKANDGRQPYGK